MSTSLRRLVIRSGLALVVTGLAVGLIWWVLDGRPELQVNDPDDLVAEVTIEEFDDVDDDVREVLQPVFDAAGGGSSSWEPRLLDDRLLVGFSSNPCPRVDLTVAAQAEGVVIELEDRPGGCDDIGVYWVAVIELREAPAPDASIDVVVDVQRGVTEYTAHRDAASASTADGSRH